ncbi:hypothetical protein [Rubrivirga sp.]|uniref:hypothetical protein n=1 Tax=Rubrivirga sp. TaxID=1885344 RepID=UPI003B528EF1
MRSRSLLSLVVVVVLAGCDSTAAIDPPAAPPPVLPLAVGTEWTLAATYSVSYDADGRARDTLRITPGTRSLELAITRDTVVAGERWVLIETTRGLAHCVFDGFSWFTNREDGLYRWRTTPEEAERVYAIGVDEGVPFFETDVVSAALVDDDASFELPTKTVAVRQYDRTWKRIEFSASVRGPIDPMPVTRDQLSSTLGPVALEISLVSLKSGSGEDAVYRPAAVLHYELTDAAVPATAEGARRAAETSEGIAVR